MSNEKVITQGKYKMTVNKVDFELDRGELEVLARHYFTQRLDYAYERFAHSDWAVSSSDWNRYMWSVLRWEAIENLLGPEEMARQKKMAEDDFKRSVGEKNWKAFTTQTPRPNCNCGDDQGCDICDPEGMEKLRKVGGVIVEEL
jgi:hypothetical protein